MNEQTNLTNPFPGLRPFQFSEKDLFFGREQQSRELLRKLRRNRFVAVVGTSGSGKSSLVRAGLLPLLANGVTAGAGDRWRVAIFRPGKNPIHNLGEALASPEAFGSAYAKDGQVSSSSEPEQNDVRVAVVETTLRRSALGLSEHAMRATESENLLICVDQFEELFRFKEQSQLSNPEDDAAAFIKLLLQSARDKNVNVYVLLTMRSDFLGECAQFRDLPETINEGQYLIPRLTRDEQRDAITEPAILRGVNLTPRLVQRLLNDVGDNPDQLPLLQHALMRTWEHWITTKASNEIDLEHYLAVGGMEKALSNHAQQTFDALPKNGPSRLIAEKLFKALTETIVNNKEIRRPAELAEICGIAAAGPEQVVPVIDHFRDRGRSFLMPPIDTELAPETIIDISHESLIKGWDLLRKWVEEEAKSKAMYQRVSDAAKRRYRESGGANLWRDPDLKFAIEWQKREQPNEIWAQRYDPAFTEAMAFLEESKEEQKKERELKEAQLREENERKEREQQRELAAAQAAAITQKQIAEAERNRAEAARGREIAEREKAEEAQRREEAERARAEEAQRREAAERARAEAERERAEEQARAAFGLRRAARRLRVALVLLILMLTITGFYYAKARQAAAEQKRLRVQADESAKEQARLRVQADESAIELQKLADRLEILSAERLKSLEYAQVAKREADIQRSLATEKARDLQIAVDKLKDEQILTAKAKKRGEAELRGLIALEKGNASDAVRMFTDLREDYAREPGGKINWAWASYNLGTAYRQAKEYDKAITSYRDALETQKVMYVRQQPEIVPALHRLSQVYYEQNNYEVAEESYNELSTTLAAIDETAQTRERIITVQKEKAKLYNDWARDVTIGARQKREEIYDAQTQARAIGDSASGNDRERKQALEEKAANLQREREALVAQSERSYRLAEQMYQAVAVAREHSLPNIHPDLIDSYNSLAAFYEERTAKDEDEDFFADDDDDEAEETETDPKALYKLARSLRENRLNPQRDDAAEAATIQKIVEAYSEAKRYQAAIRLMTRAIDIKRKLAANELDGSRPATSVSGSLLSSLGLLASLQLDSGDEAEFERSFAELERVMGIIAKNPSPNFELEGGLHTLEGFGFELGGKERYAQAQKVFEDLAMLRKKVPQSGDRAFAWNSAYNVGWNLAFVGILKQRQKDYVGAEISLKESLEIIKKDLGPNAEVAYKPLIGLAKLYLEQGRLDEALPLFQRVQEIFVTKIGPEQRAKELAPTTSRAWRTQLEIEITKSSTVIPGPNSYLDALNGLAEIYTKQGRIADAIKAREELNAVGKWLTEDIENVKYVMPSFEFDAKEVKKYRNRYEARYADSLEAYALFLTSGCEQTRAGNCL